jgi:hypothetical protein
LVEGERKAAEEALGGIEATEAQKALAVEVADMAIEDAEYVLELEAEEAIQVADEAAQDAKLHASHKSKGGCQ